MIPGKFEVPVTVSVESAVVRLVPRASRPDLPFAAIRATVRRAFSARRKKLAKALLQEHSGSRDALLEAIRGAGVDPEGRAETLPPAAFVALASALRFTGETRDAEFSPEDESER